MSPAPEFDVLIFPVWFLTSALLGVAAWQLARCWFFTDDLISMLMHTLILSWAAIVGVTFVLGTAGILTGFNLMLGVALLAIAALIGARMNRPPSATSAPETDRTESGWLVLWTGVFSLWIGHSITSGLLRFPADWDTLHYHLPLIVHWLHAGSLYAPDCGLWSIPGNNEVIGLWLVAPFSGDFMIGLNNVPAAILFACAAVDVGKQLGLSSALAHATGFAVVSTFVVLNQLLDASNDVAVAAAFLACVSYGFRSARNPDGRVSPCAFLFAVALGLLAGVKYYALGYVALAGTAFFLLTWKRQGWKRAVTFATLAAIGLCVFSGYWFLRNYWVTGSPLYPKSFDPQEDVITRIYPDISNTSFLGNRRPELFRLAVIAIWHMAGPCHVAAVVGFPLFLAGILLSAWMAMKKNQTEAADFRWTFAVLAAGACGVLLIKPFAVEDSPGTLNQMHMYYCPVRYGTCFLSLAVLTMALVLQDFLPSKRLLAWALVGVFVLCGIYQSAAPNSRLPREAIETIVIGGNLFFLAFNGFLFAMIWRPFARILGLVVLMALAGAGAWGVDQLSTKWHRQFPAFYDGHLSKGTYTGLAKKQPTGSICVLENRSYPFFGSRRQFRVCQPNYVQSSTALMEYMKEHDVGLVATRLERADRFKHFNECLSRRPTAFRKFSGDKELVLFRVVEVIP